MNNEFLVSTLNDITEEQCQEALGMSRIEAERKLISNIIHEMSSCLDPEVVRQIHIKAVKETF